MPAYNIGDRVQFKADDPFYDGIEYRVLKIQYVTEEGEFSETVTSRWQYELGISQTSSIEDHLEAVP